MSGQVPYRKQKSTDFCIASVSMQMHSLAVLARKMGRYYPLTDQEVEAAGISESEFIIPRKVDPTVFHVIVLSKKKAGGGQAV